jgi:hypothetical protein
LAKAASGIGTLTNELRGIVGRNNARAPNFDLIKVNTARALQSTQLARMLEAPLVSPAMRTDFGSLVETWCLALKTHLTKIIEGKTIPVNGQDHAADDGDDGEDTGLAEATSTHAAGEPDAIPPPSDTPFWLDAATPAINGERRYQKQHFYAAILAIGQRLKVLGESPDATRQRAMKTQEGAILWAAHNAVDDLPPKVK